MSHTAINSTTDREALERRLVALLSDAKDAAIALDRLDDVDLCFDIGIELHAARKALQNAADILDRLPAFSRHDAEPRYAAGVVAY